MTARRTAAPHGAPDPSPTTNRASIAAAPPAYGIDLVDAAAGGRGAGASATLPLEQALRRLPALPQNDALGVLKRFQRAIAIRISTGERRIQLAMSQRAESFGSYLIGGTIEVFGLTSLPSEQWEEAWKPLNAAYATIAGREVKASLDLLLAAAAATNRYWEQLNAHLEKTDQGADRSIFALQALEAAGAVAASLLTGGGAAGILVGAGYAGTQNLVGQATSMSIGIQDKIDWAGLAFDTVFGAITGVLGGKLGNVVLKRLVGNPAVASVSRRLLAEVVSDLISGRLSSILQTTAHTLFDQLRGREALTMEQFIGHLSDELMDPKAMFLDAILGRAAKLAHASSARPGAPAAHEAAAPREPAPAAHEIPPPAPLHAQEPGGLELDLSGSREGWNKHVEEYQARDEAKLRAETQKPGFGAESSERGGTEHHTGMNFHEYSAAEVAIGLRVDWDPQAGRPRKVTYNFTSAAAKVASQVTERSFHQEPRLKGESAQSREKAYTKSGYDKGHLAQRQAGKVDPAIDAALGLENPTGREVERALDVLTNVAPMTPTLNRGKGSAWASAENRTAQFALQHGYVTVEITPIYDAQPPRLSDGTPIPRQFRRTIKSGPTGNVLEDLVFDNK
ncbi:MAG TPA: DNA/RNA non-specific endonuclease [Kofleriaceae bacterium]